MGLDMIDGMRANDEVGRLGSSSGSASTRARSWPA